MRHSHPFWNRGVKVLYYCWAGLFWSKCDLAMQMSPLIAWLVVRIVDPHWEEWHNSFADFNPNHNHVNAAPKQASLKTSRPNHICMQPQAKLLYEKYTNLWKKNNPFESRHLSNRRTQKETRCSNWWLPESPVVLCQTGPVVCTRVAAGGALPTLIQQRVGLWPVPLGVHVSHLK